MQSKQYGARTSLSASRGDPLSDLAKIRIDNLFALRAQADRMSALH
ncbi:MAG: hypothetical protein QOH71_2512 [Blastocatellia bacterium]|jgi:hypothetical protein|nr:hypothetical protein [Blastocatellia bacterium]